MKHPEIDVEKFYADLSKITDLVDETPTKLSDTECSL